jgi:transposase
MARSYRPVVRDQEFLLPPNMAEWLAADHLVWFVLDVVDRLDTSGFHVVRRTGGVGRAGYDPDMLLALMIYAYACGERSSRRIERLCTDHVAYRVVCAQDPPDHTTIARFRAAHDQAFTDMFTQVLRLCAQAGMVSVGVISIDGTKIAANAAKSANRSQDWVRDRARRIAEDVVREAVEVDAAEGAAEAAAGPRPAPPELCTPAARAAAIKNAMEEIARQDARDAAADAADRERQEQYLRQVEAGQTPVGPPPAGIDKVRLYEVRIARDQQRLAELGDGGGKPITERRSDFRKSIKRWQAALEQARAEQAAGLADQRGSAARVRDYKNVRRAQRGSSLVVNLTDPEARLMTEGSGGGSVQGYNSQIVCSNDHLVIGVHVSQDANDTNCWTPALAAATAQTEALDKTIGLALADNGYFTEDNLTAPGPERLIGTGSRREMDHEVKHNPADGPPPPDLSPLDAMRHKMRQPDNVEQYKRRSATVEPVIGHLKDRIGLRRYARRGLQAVNAELHLAAAVLNLTRLHHGAVAA